MEIVEISITKLISSLFNLEYKNLAAIDMKAHKEVEKAVGGFIAPEPTKIIEAKS